MKHLIAAAVTRIISAANPDVALLVRTLKSMGATVKVTGGKSTKVQAFLPADHELQVSTKKPGWLYVQFPSDAVLLSFKKMGYALKPLPSGSVGVSSVVGWRTLTKGTTTVSLACLPPSKTKSKMQLLVAVFEGTKDKATAALDVNELADQMEQVENSKGRNSPEYLKLQTQMQKALKGRPENSEFSYKVWKHSGKPFRKNNVTPFK